MKTLLQIKLWWVWAPLVFTLQIYAQSESTDKSPHKAEFITAAGERESVLTDAALPQILEERIKAKKAVGLVVGRLQGTNRS